MEGVLGNENLRNRRRYLPGIGDDRRRLVVGAESDEEEEGACKGLFASLFLLLGVKC